MQRISVPEKTYWVCDATDPRVDLFYFKDFVPAYRHGKAGPSPLMTLQEKAAVGRGFNFGYFDGHASWTNWKVFVDWYYNANPQWISGDYRFF